MREIGVVIVDPTSESNFEVEGFVPLVGPDEVLLDGTHDAFGVGVALGIGPGGEDLLDAER